MLLLLLAAAWTALFAPCPADAQEATIPLQIERPDTVSSDEVDLLLFQGQLALEAGDLQEAMDKLTRVVALAPERLEGHLSLARALTSALLQERITNVSDASARALAEYRWVLAHEPGNREAQEGIRILGDRFFEGIAVPLQTEKGRRSWEAGLRALSNDDYDGAIRALQAAAEAEPKVPDVHRMLGEALRRAGRPEEALAEMQTALSLSPGDPEAEAAAGALLEARGDTAAALEHYRRAFAVNDDQTEAAQGLIRILRERKDTLSNDDLALLGRAYLAVHDAEQAARILETAAAEDPSPANRKALGIAQFFRGRNTEAAILLTGVHEALPDDGETLYYLAASLMRSGRMAEGKQYLHDALGLDPNDANALRLLGLALADQPGSEEEAIALLERARRAGSDASQLSCVLGSLQMRLGNDDVARIEFQRCLEQHPDDPQAILGLGIIADREGRKGTAIVQYEKYIKLEKADPSVLFRLGVAYLRVGQDERGFETLRRVLEVDTTLAAADTVSDTELLELATLFLATIRRLDDAIFIGEMLLTRDPDNDGYNNNLAMSYADAGKKPKRAYHLAMKANQLRPGEPGHLDTLGWTLVRLERYAAAEDTLKKAIRLARETGRRDLSELFYHLGYLYRLEGRDVEAKEYLTRALENPPTPYLRAEIERLLRLEERKTQAE